VILVICTMQADQTDELWVTN